MIPVILSGGSGTRLWPLSRDNWPKQFVTLFEKSLMESTLGRVKSLGNPWILTNQKLKDLTQLSLLQAEIKGAEVLLEPLSKNTAPAIAYLVSQMVKKGLSEEIVAVLPADQLVEDEAEFLNSMRSAETLALSGVVATIGITPTRPETGYGYIEKANPIAKVTDAFGVQKFHEKPKAAAAEEYVKSGRFLWNAGIFVFKVSTMQKLMDKYCPEVIQPFFKSTDKSIEDLYRALPSVSIDYALIEKLAQSEISCVQASFDWSDVGSWDSVAEKSQTQRHYAVQSKNVFVKGLEEKTYAVIGLDDIHVIDTQDACLIMKQGLSQDVRLIVEKLKADKSAALNEIKTEVRPWGEFSILKESTHFKSKIIRVNPAAQISYQSHEHREEHWTVIAGEGDVILNDQVIPVKKGSYVHIPKKSKHRIRNKGAQQLEFIEVQMGEYFGEDDIVRYSDDYHRV